MEREPLPWPEVPWDETDVESDTDADERAIANVRALMDVLIPAHRNEAGELLSAGALEVGAYELLSLSTFVDSARQLGFLREVPEALDAAAEGFDAVLRTVLSSDLDALAFEHSPWSPFSELPLPRRIAVVQAGFADPLTRPLLLFVRAACFVAYLGAVHSDVGLRQAGFPAFEDFEGRVAVSGYPRTTEGRLIDAEVEDLAALAARGELDDYTYNLAPLPTPDDDLSGVLDEHGDIF